MAEKEGERSRHVAGESNSFTETTHGRFYSRKAGGRFCWCNLTSEDGRRPSAVTALMNGGHMRGLNLSMAAERAVQKPETDLSIILLNFHSKHDPQN